MARPYIDHSVEELEKLFKNHLNHLAVLGALRDELTYRESRRAKQVLTEIEGVLAGRVPVPAKPPKPDSPTNQIRLI